MRRFAEDTTVPVSRSREAIDALLRDWGCHQLEWGADFARGRVRLRFVWTHNERDYLARIDLALPTDEQLRKEAIDTRDPKGKRIAEGKLYRLQSDRGKREHRLLLLWLKASLNAVREGLVSAEALFLPFLEGTDGRTVAEIAVPRMGMLTTGDASRLLPAPGDK